MSNLPDAVQSIASDQVAATPSNAFPAIESTLAARQIAEALFVEMAWRTDHGQAPAALDLFADDAQFTTPFGVLDREGLRTFLTARAAASHRTRHAVTSTRVEKVGAATLQASAFVSVRRIEDGQPSAQFADWTMTAVQSADGWKISAFKVSPFDVEGSKS